MQTLRRHAESRERARLLSWRVQLLVAARVDRPLAQMLAGDPRYDLHALVELLERGCPPALAARIVSPADQVLAPADDVVRP